MNNSNPLVSICIPTYEQNGVGAKHLKQLLQSITSNDLIEIIISDNSDDDVIERMVLDFHGDDEDDPFTIKVNPLFAKCIANLKYIRNQQKGAAYNANHAINQATGDIIKIMFMDDYFTGEGALNHYITALADPGKHWAIANSIWVDDDGKHMRDFNARYDGALPKGKNTIGMPSVIAFKKTDLRFDASFTSSFDTEFYYRMYQQYGPPAHIPERVIAQRIHKNSLSSLQKDHRSVDLIKMNGKHTDKISFFHRRRGMVKNPDGSVMPLPDVGMIKTYDKLCKTPSDINEHLPLLKEIGMLCEHITEFGVRNVVSTYAFLEATPKTLVCYDIKSSPQITAALKLAKEMGVELKYKIIDVLKANIAETDFLFIDTLHDYAQLKKELELHAPKVRKFIGFHDVTYFGLKDESKNEEPKQGLIPAILEFLQDHPEWSVYKYIWGGNPKWNNGCLILKRDEEEEK